MNLNKKTTIGALGGTLAEYYDYSLYGFSSAFIAKAFFPTADETLSTIVTFGVFAVGYLSKPLGALIFGYLGDRYGRKFCLNLTVIGIALPTFAIGLCPSHAEIGILAGILVTFFRFLQGIFVGGEYDGAAIYLLEHQGKKKSGYASALMRSSSVAGLLLGALASNSFTYFSEEYWRYPFLLSLALMFFTLYFRPSMAETPEFLEYWNKKKNQQGEVERTFKEILQSNWKNIVIAALMFGCASGCVQFLLYYMKSFLPTLIESAKAYANTVHFLGILSLGISMLGTAYFSDRIGLLKMMRYAFLTCFVATLVLIVGFWTNSFALVIIGYLGLCFCIGPVSGLMHGVICRIFAVQERYRCVSIAHNFGSMLLSGSTPFFASVLYKLTAAAFAPLLYLLTLLSCAFFLSKFITEENKAVV